LTVRRWIALWFEYLKLGWQLRCLTADRRSRWLMTYLGATTLFRSNPRLLRRAISVSVRLGSEAYRVALKTRTELDVLKEIGIDDEYRPADEISADTIVDLGASIGLASLRLLSSHPGARVIAVEADPVLIPRLRANVAGLPVTVIHAAVAATSGSRPFYRSDIDSWANSLDRTSATQTPVPVPALSLGDLLDSNQLDHVDLLKLDVEGAEWEIFEGPVDPRIAAIVGEVHRRGANTPEEFIENLSSSMRIDVISAKPGQATFVASRPRIDS
jgi:FkbM family methyltransferase